MEIIDVKSNLSKAMKTFHDRASAKDYNTKKRNTISYQKLKTNLTKNISKSCAHSENYIFRHQTTANSKENQKKFWVKLILSTLV